MVEARSEFRLGRGERRDRSCYRSLRRAVDLSRTDAPAGEKFANIVLGSKSGLQGSFCEHDAVIRSCFANCIGRTPQHVLRLIISTLGETPGIADHACSVAMFARHSGPGKMFLLARWPACLRSRNNRSRNPTLF